MEKELQSDEVGKGIEPEAYVSQSAKPQRFFHVQWCRVAPWLLLLSLLVEFAQVSLVGLPLFQLLI